MTLEIKKEIISKHKGGKSWQTECGIWNVEINTQLHTQKLGQIKTAFIKWQFY